MIKIEKNSILQIIGAFCMFYWSIDTVNNLFILHNPAWVLWLSSTGFALTGLALVTRNAFLLNSMFCVLFFAETFWIVGYLSLFFFRTNILGIAEYAFSPTFPVKDYIITLYHLLIAPALLIGMFLMRKVYSYAWIGSAGYTATLIALSYFFVDASNGVNCVHNLYYCRDMLAFLSPINLPERLFVGYVLFILVFILPTNYILIKIGKIFNWERVDIKKFNLADVFSPLQVIVEAFFTPVRK